MSELVAIVTAAGASRRMAEYDHKALLPWRGRPLIAHQVETLREADFSPIVVTGAESDAVADATPASADLVHNPDWKRGRSSSIATGADAVPDDADAVLVVAVDQPVSVRILEQLRPAAGVPLVQPVDDTHGAGHPVIVGGAYLEALRNLQRGDGTLRSLVDRLRPSGEMVSVDELPHWDLNTPEEYDRARSRAKRMHCQR